MITDIVIKVLVLVTLVILAARFRRLYLVARDYDENQVIEIGHFEDWGDKWKADYTTTRGPGGADAEPSDTPPSKVIRDAYWVGEWGNDK
jgi:hypothetical protein